MYTGHTVNNHPISLKSAIQLFLYTSQILHKKRPKSGAVKKIRFVFLYYLLNGARYKKMQTHSNSRGCALLALGKLKDKQFKNVHC